MELSDFIIWATSVAGSGAIASFILERLSWFQGLSSDARKWASFGTMSAVGVLALLVINFVPAEILASLAPYAAILISAFLSVFSGSVWHNKVDKPSGKG